MIEMLICVVCTCLLMGACKDPATNAAAADAGVYTVEMEKCFQLSSNCNEYVACSHAVQRRFNQPESGSCALQDAGSDAQ